MRADSRSVTLVLILAIAVIWLGRAEQERREAVRACVDAGGSVATCAAIPLNWWR